MGDSSATVNLIKTLESETTSKKVNRSSSNSRKKEPNEKITLRYYLQYLDEDGNVVEVYQKHPELGPDNVFSKYSVQCSLYQEYEDHYHLSHGIPTPGNKCYNDIMRVNSPMWPKIISGISWGMVAACTFVGILCGILIGSLPTSKLETQVSELQERLAIYEEVDDIDADG